MKSLFMTVIAVTCLLLVGQVGAEHVKRPVAYATAKASYHEVWGIEVDFPDWAKGQTRSAAYITKDGDIVVFFSFSHGKPHGPGEVIVDYYRNKILFSEKECSYATKPECYERFSKFLFQELKPEALRQVMDYALFGPNKGVHPHDRFSHRLPFYGCLRPQDGFVRLERQHSDHSIEVVYNKSLIYMPPEPVRFDVETPCFGGIYYLTSYTFGQNLYYLPDGTLLMVPAQRYGTAPPFIFRYKPDLTSPFIDQRDELFLIEYDLLQKFGTLANHLLPPWEAHRLDVPIRQRPAFTLDNVEIENPILTLYLRKYLKERKLKHE